MKKERKKRECGRKRQTQLTIHDCSNKTCPASSPPVPLVVMEGLPRLLLSSLEPVESPPPTLLWGLARSCISIDLRGREGVDGENEGGREWEKMRQLWFLNEDQSDGRALPQLGIPHLCVLLCSGAPANTSSERPRPRTFTQTHVSTCSNVRARCASKR